MNDLTRLQVTHLNGDVTVYDLKSWEVTAAGCIFETIDDEYLVIHPQSVRMMRRIRQGVTTQIGQSKDRDQST